MEYLTPFSQVFYTSKGINTNRKQVIRGAISGHIYQGIKDVTTWIWDDYRSLWLPPRVGLSSAALPLQ